MTTVRELQERIGAIASAERTKLAGEDKPMRQRMPETAKIVDAFRAAGINPCGLDMTEDGHRVVAGRKLPDRVVPYMPPMVRPGDLRKLVRRR